MAQITITINSREYAVGAEDGQETNIIKLAAILDEKAKLITSSIGQINENMLLAMVGLLVADELSELKKNKDGNLQKNSEKEEHQAFFKEQDSMLADKIKEITNKINSIVKDM